MEFDLEDKLNIDFTRPTFIKLSDHIDLTELLGEGNDKLITNTGVS